MAATLHELAPCARLFSCELWCEVCGCSELRVQQRAHPHATLCRDVRRPAPVEIDMRIKRFVASVVAFLFLIVFLSPDGTPRARFAGDVCAASHTKLDAAIHNSIHAAPGSSRVQAIVGVRAGTLDSVSSAVALLGAQIHAIHRGLPALSLDVGVSALGTLA